MAATGAFGGYVARANASSTLQVWALDPNWDGGDPATCGCGACRACRAHSANRWFASAAAADAGRAHVGCKCGVVPLIQLDESVYNALFVDGAARGFVDLRYQWVQAVLAQAPDLPDATLGGAGGATPGAAPIATIKAVVRPVPVQSGVNGRRVLLVDIHTDETVTASIAVTRGGQMIAHKAVRGVHGTRRLRLHIPPQTTAGPARLRVKLRNSAGHSKIVTRAIQIPRVSKTFKA